MGSNLESRGWVYAYYSYLKQLWPESYSCRPVSRARAPGKVNTLKDALPFGQLSHSPQTQVQSCWGVVPCLSQLPAPQAPKPLGVASGVVAREQMLTNESGKRVGEQSSTSRPPCPGCFGSISAWWLMAKGRAIVLWRLGEQLQSPRGARRSRALTMWQAWMDAHDRARLPVPPAKEPDAAIGKNCFIIWNLGPLIIARRGWRGEVQSGGLKMPASPRIHQCLLYCLLSGTVLLMSSFFCNQVILPSPSRPSRGKGEMGGKGAVCSLLFSWPTTPTCAPAFRVICFLFFHAGLFFQSLVTNELSSAECCALPFCTCNPNTHFLSFRHLKLAFQGPAVLQS